MASQMEDEMRNLPSLTAVLFHGCYTWCIGEVDSDLMNKVRSHVSILKCSAWAFLAVTFFFSSMLISYLTCEILLKPAYYTRWPACNG